MKSVIIEHKQHRVQQLGIPLISSFLLVLLCAVLLNVGS